MRVRAVWSVVLSVSVFWPVSASAQVPGVVGGTPPRLKVGDPAPPLSIAEWVKGSPVRLADGKGKKAYVIEFWATWCGPCRYSIPELTDLQANYGDKGLTVVGVTSPDMRGNTLSAVKKYVAQWGDKMNYTVAFDKDTATSEAYMDAANQYGIPTAFVVDRQGKIAWIGTPIGPEVSDVVDQVISGSFDVTRHAALQKMYDQASQLIGQGDWPAVIGAMKDILKVDPTQLRAIEAMYLVHVQELEDTEGLRAWAGEYIEQHRTDARAMTGLANQLMSTGILTNRFPDLALRAAHAAVQAGGDKDVDAAATYARALYQIGAVDEAIKAQEKAVANAKGKMAADMKAVLAFYRACQRARAGLRDR